MRLDKFISSEGIASRSDVSKAAKTGNVTVNGAIVKKADIQIDPEVDKVVFFGREVTYKKFVYVMLNKPEGYVSATEDGRDPTVLQLLPEELQKRELFPCGRLDKNTVGLMLLTDNGELTYTLIVQNLGNTAIEATDGLTVSDLFSPILSDITVTLDGAPLAEGTGYTYDEATGAFTTLDGAIAVPAATYTQNPDTGLITTTPGVAVLTIVGTV